MKRIHAGLIIVELTLILVCFMAGYFYGRHTMEGTVVETLRQDEEKPEESPYEGLDVVNLNTATAFELEILPGIGKVIAQEIIRYREEHGGFSTIEELMNVSGIGQAKFEEIKPWITVR